MKILGLVILLFLHFDSGNWSKQMDIDDYFPIEEYFPLLLNTRYIYESIEEDRNGNRSRIEFKCWRIKKLDWGVEAYFQNIDSTGDEFRLIYRVSPREVQLVYSRSKRDPGGWFLKPQIIIKLPLPGNEIEWMADSDILYLAELTSKIKTNRKVYQDGLIVTIDDQKEGTSIKLYYAKGIGLVKKEVYPKKSRFKPDGLLSYELVLTE